jgi:hypothetical protein
VVEQLGGGKRPAVHVTVAGFSYRSTVSSMGGKFLIPLSAARRAEAGVKGGDVVEVELSLDTVPRAVDMPADFATRLEAEPKAKAFFETLSYSNQLRHVLSITDAKTDETRQKRIAKAIETLLAGKK